MNGGGGASQYEAADSKRSASIGLGVGGALLLGVSIPLIAFLGGAQEHPGHSAIFFLLLGMVQIVHHEPENRKQDGKCSRLPDSPSVFWQIGLASSRKRSGFWHCVSLLQADSETATIFACSREPKRVKLLRYPLQKTPRHRQRWVRVLQKYCPKYSLKKRFRNHRPQN